MSNFKQAIQWMKEGKKVRRKSWPGKYCNLAHEYGEILRETGKGYVLNFNEVDAIDWEIYEEETLSNNECFILTNTINLDEIKPLHTTSIGDLRKVKINIPEEELRFRKGFFTEDVKDSIQKIKSRIPKECSFVPETGKPGVINVHAIIDEEMGSKLI